MKYILLITLIAFCTASCNDWLDVRPETEQKDLATTGWMCVRKRSRKKKTNSRLSTVFSTP